MKNLAQVIGFQSKENTNNIFIKKYKDGYCIEIDFEKNTFHFGGKIKISGKDFQNITKPEDWVVIECVNRLLETGYKPENIILEKVYPAGHGFSGRLDVCVNNDDGSEYLLIECKTYSKEFDKEFTRLKKDGGQLFTYFKFSNKANVIMLYASHLVDGKIEYKNEIIKIEDTYKKGDVKDFHNSWNKKTYQNIVWENLPYNSEIKKSFTKAQLKPLSKDQSDKIFHGFASILRKHSVSDKPNAFNVIFNLFLAKLSDEAKGDDEQLEFYWDDSVHPVDFQVNLYNLYKEGLNQFLNKEIDGIHNSDFGDTHDVDELRERKKKLFKFNNILAIKQVIDNDSFDENQRVLKEVVQLLQKYRIRYPRKQQHLSDFFELLLTTGLKQEVGQYFTPPPVTKFIVRSLPLKDMILRDVNQKFPVLPAAIDYAAGSGHFITEALEAYQDIINCIDINNDLKTPNAKTEVASWQVNPYNWASTYMYGIEKDYRLVKVAKVGCYFYGDGVAQIIHGDGLDSFAKSKTYKGLLSENINIEDSSKAKFSVVISNPPYAVNDCKDDLEYIGAEKEYTLYNSLSDKSKDIECLFVERTKHLLKDGGVASLILPSSILNNTGIQTKTREIILQYFDIVAIAELGSNTFMATGTNTVTLFLRRRANKLSVEWRKSLKTFFENFQDITINGIEKPVAKYIKHVFENITFADYISMLEKIPNETIQNHEIYKEYRKKLKAKNEKEFWNLVIDREADKLFYFIIALNQKVVLVKSGEKEIEKRFLGYEFSSRRNSEGMHAMQRDKTVDECTQMYDAKLFDNPEKASTYILKAYNNVAFEIDPKMQNHISQHDLVDMMTFDRVEFEKTISLAVKKKVKIESKWEIVRISDICEVGRGRVINKKEIEQNTGIYPVYSSQTSNNGIFGNLDTFDFEGEYVTWTTDGIYAGSVFHRNGKFNCTNVCGTLKSISKKIDMKFLSVALPNYTGLHVVKNANPKLMNNVMAAIQIPLPPLNIQQKIVSEIEVLESKEKKSKKEVEKLKSSIYSILNKYQKGSISEICKVSDKKENPQNNLDKEYIYLGLEHIESNSSKITLNKEFGRQILSTKNIFVEGDILYGKLRPYLNKVAEPNFAGICSTDILVLKTNIPKILKWLLLSDDLVSQTSVLMKGVSLPRIGITDFLNQKIPLPPLSEQQKIVPEIEKIEAKITVLETEVAEIPKQKEAILKKYL